MSFMNITTVAAMILKDLSREQAYSLLVRINKRLFLFNGNAAIGKLLFFFSTLAEHRPRFAHICNGTMVTKALSSKWGVTNLF